MKVEIVYLEDFQRMERKLDAILHKQNRILKSLHHDEERDEAMAKTYQELLDAVRKANTMSDSVIEYNALLKQKLKEALAKQMTPEMEAAIDAAVNDLNVQADESGAAIIDNTGASMGGIRE